MTTRAAAALEFVELMVKHGVLRFGRFTLKSGRESPYFFDDSAGVSVLGSAYARAIVAHGFEPDVVFGPAYKGIPIAVATCIALHRDHGRNVGLVFNRKEEKDHGEGGVLIGHRLEGKVLIVDDVMTAGTAVKESAATVTRSGATLHGILVALDRCERAEGGRTAVAQTAVDLGVPVKSIAALDDVIAYLDAHLDIDSGHADALGRIRTYQTRHCVRE